MSRARFLASVTGAEIYATPEYKIPAALRRIARKHGVPASKILTDKRSRGPYTSARWEFWRQCDASGLSLAAIGRATGFNHTSVAYAKKRGWVQ